MEWIACLNAERAKFIAAHRTCVSVGLSDFFKLLPLRFTLGSLCQRKQELQFRQQRHQRQLPHHRTLIDWPLLAKQLRSMPRKGSTTWAKVSVSSTSGDAAGMVSQYGCPISIADSSLLFRFV